MPASCLETVRPKAWGTHDLDMLDAGKAEEWRPLDKNCIMVSVILLTWG